MEKLYKRCPRCNRKMNALSAKCDTCGLIFDRLNNATNRAGKKALSKGETNKVVYVKTPPRDVNKWILMVLDIFFGLIGVHYFKVGRIKMGILMAVSLFLFLLYNIVTYFGLLPASILNNQFLGVILYFLQIPEAFCAIIWFSSIFFIAFNNFKYPVSIDEEYVIETTNPEVAKEIINSVKKS